MRPHTLPRDGGRGTNGGSLLGLDVRARGGRPTKGPHGGGACCFPDSRAPVVFRAFRGLQRLCPNHFLHNQWNVQSSQSLSRTQSRSFLVVLSLTGTGCLVGSDNEWALVAHYPLGGPARTPSGDSGGGSFVCFFAVLPWCIQIAFAPTLRGL